jgi:hypothetical protein
MAERRNDYFETFNEKLRDELLNEEIFYSLKEAQIVIEQWRKLLRHDPTALRAWLSAACAAHRRTSRDAARRDIKHWSALKNFDETK